MKWSQKGPRFKGSHTRPKKDKPAPLFLGSDDDNRDERGDGDEDEAVDQ